jgi:GpV-like protein with Apex motif
MTQTADPGSVGYSQQGPNEFSTDFSKVRFLVAQMQAALETMMPVQVVTFHAGSGSPPASGTVDVQLLVSQIDGAGHVIPHGTVYGLTVYRAQGGPWAIILDPAENDFGYIVAGARDISAVKANPGVQQPGSKRTHSYSDGVYMGGMLNAVPAGYVWLKSDGTLAVSDSKGNVLTTSSSGWNFAGNVTFQNNVQVDGTLNSTGDGVIDGVDIKTHVHSGVQTGGGDTGPPV